MTAQEKLGDLAGKKIVHQLGLLSEPQEAGQRAAFIDGRELALRRPLVFAHPKGFSLTRRRSRTPR